MPPTRRSCLLGLAALACARRPPDPPVPADLPLHAELAELERSRGGRLGVALWDPQSGLLAGHRPHERQGMCSTFKLPLVGLLLEEVEAGRRSLGEAVPLDSSPPFHSPVTGPRWAEGALPLMLLLVAAQQQSDNGATNALLRLIGGPEGYTAALRARGDQITRLDRWEPEMNLVLGEDPRDTTSPAAMAATVGRLTLGPALPEARRALLLRWMEETRTGARRLRAGLPPGWRSGDKTGTGIHPDMPTRVNDVALLWPPGGQPLILAAYREAPGPTEAVPPEEEALLAEVGRLAAAWWLQRSAEASTPARAQAEGAAR